MLRSLSVAVLLAAGRRGEPRRSRTRSTSSRSPAARSTSTPSRGRSGRKTPPSSTSSRRVYRLKPRGEFTSKVFQIGVGGDFIYSSEHNNDIPEGLTTLPLLRDNFISKTPGWTWPACASAPSTAFSVQGGRFVMPIRFTEMIWDRDLRVAGRVGDHRLRLAGTAAAVRRHRRVRARQPHPPAGGARSSSRTATSIWIGSATMTFSAGARRTASSSWAPT